MDQEAAQKTGEVTQAAKDANLAAQAAAQQATKELTAAKNAAGGNAEDPAVQAAQAKFDAAKAAAQQARNVVKAQEAAKKNGVSEEATNANIDAMAAAQQATEALTSAKNAVANRATEGEMMPAGGTEDPGSDVGHEYRDELVERNGEIGNKLNSLFLRLMKRQARRFSNFALRDGSLRSVEELTLCFYAERGQQICTKILSGFLRDDEAVERYLSKAMWHWLINEFKKTPEGRVFDILTHRMNRDKQQRFTHVKGTNIWGLENGPGQPSKVSEGKLKYCARSYPITMSVRSYAAAEWDAAGTRRRAPNIGKAGELETLLEGVLLEAQGTVEMMVLVRVVMDRVPALTGPKIVSLEEVGGADAFGYATWRGAET